MPGSVAVRGAVVLADHAVLVGNRELRAVKQRITAWPWIAGGKLEAVDGEVDDRLPIAGEKRPAVVVAESPRVLAQNRRRVAGGVDTDRHEPHRSVLRHFRREPAH